MFTDSPDKGVLCLSKATDNNPATAGQLLTFTLTVFFGDEFCKAEFCSFSSGAGITDILPSSVRFVEATANNEATCTKVDNTVNCARLIARNDAPFVANIKVIPEQCGTFTNTATAPISGPQEEPVTVSLPFTVEGCPLPTPQASPAPSDKDKKKHHNKNKGGGGGGGGISLG